MHCDRLLNFALLLGISYLHYVVANVRVNYFQLYIGKQLSNICETHTGLSQFECARTCQTRNREVLHGCSGANYNKQTRECDLSCDTDDVMTETGTEHLVALVLLEQPAVCDNACVNGGECTAPNTCTCPTGYTGDSCEQAVCDNTCVNGGECTAPNTCTCPTGYTGNACETAVCDITCLNGGDCTAPNTCTCPNGYAGNSCEQAVCDIPCMNGGNCTAPNTCTCLTGYTGDSCEQAVCDITCVNGGECTAPNSCTCPTGYTGNACEQAVCDIACVNGGNCTTPNNCTCPTGYTGNACETVVCDSIPWLLNDGNCTYPYKYTCTGGYTGDSNETVTCAGNDYLVSGTGANIVPDECLTSSSHYTDGVPNRYTPNWSRLNSSGTFTGAWSVAVNDPYQWIQAHFNAPKSIKQIQIRGRAAENQYVTEFSVSFSTDCTTFQAYSHSNGTTMKFTGNANDNTVVTQLLPTPVSAACVKLHPTNFQSYTSLRWDILGC